MAGIIDAVSTWLFTNVVMWSLLGAGVFLTLRFGVVQLRRLPEAFRAMVAQQSKDATGGVLSPFQAFMTALAASIGTGNIAGVATAIISGGPGALFWIWVYGFVATAVKFAEAVLGVTYRETTGDQVRCGPMYYLRDGLKSPALAWIYALVAGVAALTTTPFTQPNSIAIAVNTVFGVPTWIVGVVVAVLTWARDHRRREVHWPRGGEAGAAQGRPLPDRRHRRHRHLRRPPAARVLARSSAKR